MKTTTSVIWLSQFWALFESLLSSGIIKQKQTVTVGVGNDMYQALALWGLSDECALVRRGTSSRVRFPSRILPSILLFFAFTQSLPLTKKRPQLCCFLWGCTPTSGAPSD